MGTQIFSWRQYRAYQVVSASLHLMHVVAVICLTFLVGWGIWALVQVINFWDKVDERWAQIDTGWERLNEAMRHNAPAPPPLDLAPLPDAPGLPFGLSISQALAAIGIYAVVFTILVVVQAILDPIDDSQNGLDTVPV